MTLHPIKIFADNYHLTDVCTSSIGDWSSNENFLIKCQEGTFIFVILEEQGHEEVTRMVSWLLWLEKHNIDTSRLIPTIQGDWVIDVGGKPAYMKTYLEGSVQRQHTLGELKQAGAALGKVHMVPSPANIRLDHYYEKPMFSEMIGKNIDPDYENWLEQRLKFLKSRLETQLPKGLIHGDLFWDNVLFEDQKIVAIIDFEMACDHVFVFDIGMALVGLCSPDHQFQVDAGRAFLEGYQQVRPIQKEEKKALQYYMEYTAVRTSNWRVWRFCYTKPNPARQHAHREMSQLAKSIAQWNPMDFINALFYLNR